MNTNEEIKIGILFLNPTLIYQKLYLVSKHTNATTCLHSTIIYKF